MTQEKQQRQERGKLEIDSLVPEWDAIKIAERRGWQEREKYDEALRTIEICTHEADNFYSTILSSCLDKGENRQRVKRFIDNTPQDIERLYQSAKQLEVKHSPDSPSSWVDHKFNLFKERFERLKGVYEKQVSE